MSGTFSPLSFGPHAHNVSYSASAVTLTLATQLSLKALGTGLWSPSGARRRASSETSSRVDALVIRGYLDRTTDPDDRRRMTIALTDRGHAASAVVEDGVESVDAELAAKLSESELAGPRAGLVALCDIRDRMEQGG